MSISIALWSAVGSAESAMPRIIPLLEQKVALFSSPRVTAGGLGGGLGLEALWARKYALELQADLLWAMGNAGLLQASGGIQRDGFYQPGVRVTWSMLVGDRIETLFDDGRRPARPSWAIGPRIIPLRFGSDAAFASALECGIGTDFQRGLFFELSVLKAGGRW